MFFSFLQGNFYTALSVILEMDLEDENFVIPSTTTEAHEIFTQAIIAENWTHETSTTLKDGRVFEMFGGKSKGGIPPLKCVGVIKTEASKILDFYLNAPLDIRKKATPNLSKYNIIKDYEKDIQLLHYVYKAPFPVKSRDFSLKRFVYQSDTECLICGISVVDEDLPEMKKYIRGKIFIPGYHLETLPEGETRITSIVSLDPGGWVPNFLIKASKNGELAELVNLSKILENGK